MATPITKECKHHEVTLIATAVLKAGLTIMEGNKKKYYRTWTDPADPAPLPPTNLDNPRIPSTSIWLEIPEYNSKFIPTSLSNLYIYCTGGNPEVHGLIEVAI